jgi:uncharacterized iron-regulated protein
MRPRRRGVRWLASVLGMAAMLVMPSAASACKYILPQVLAAIGTAKLKCAHPLCGVIHAPHAKPLSAYPNDRTSCGPADRRAMDINAPMLALEQSGGYLLLGETHDNALHHEIRAKLLGLDWRNASARPRGIVFEHIRADQQAALDQAKPATAADMMRVLDWDTSGWPKDQMFAPLFDAALAAKLPIFAGDPPRAQVRAVAKDGMNALDPAEVARLHLDQPLAPKPHEALLTELEASHCGLMPKTAFGTMAVAQRYRDAHLAAQLIKAADPAGSAILLAGNGHVRSDRGVPHYLRQLAPNRPIVSVMLIEVEDGKTDPAAYVPHDTDGKPAADYLVFTPRAARTDPCVEMRARFGKKG